MTPITPQEMRKEAVSEGHAAARHRRLADEADRDTRISSDEELRYQTAMAASCDRRAAMINAGADALEFTCGQCGNTAAQGHKLDCRLAAGYTSRFAEALEEVERLNKMRTHCTNCGADYMATGIEAGCPCLLKAQVATLTQAVVRLTEAALDHDCPSFGMCPIHATTATPDECPYWVIGGLRVVAETYRAQVATLTARWEALKAWHRLQQVAPLTAASANYALKVMDELEAQR